MDKIVALVLLIFLFACNTDSDNPVMAKKISNKNSNKRKKRDVSNDTGHLKRPLYNWELLDTADRKNIYEDTVPVFLKEFARKNEFPCPDTLTGCAACGHCAYIKLSDDWKYFAFERQETKHYCGIKIYRSAKNRIIPLDTLYGTIISSEKRKGEKVYQLVLLEAYWKDERPMNIEYYRFENGQFHLRDSIIGKW